jgi:hypothetical protein
MAYFWNSNYEMLNIGRDYVHLIIYFSGDELHA